MAKRYDFDAIRLALVEYLAPKGRTAKKLSEETGIAEPKISSFKNQVTRTIQDERELEDLVTAIGRDLRDFQFQSDPGYWLCRSPECPRCLWHHVGKVRIYMPSIFPKDDVTSNRCPDCNRRTCDSCPSCGAPLTRFARCPAVDCGEPYVEITPEFDAMIDLAASEQHEWYFSKLTSDFKLRATRSPVPVGFLKD